MTRLAGDARIIPSLVAMAVLAACAVGPDFEPPAAPDVPGYTAQPLVQRTATADVKGGEAQRFVQDLDIPGQWWTLFHSPALNHMVEEALRNNPTLPAAEAVLRQAWENVYAEQGAFFPTAVVSYSPSRNKTATGITFTAASSGKPWFTLHTAQVVVTYAPDVFGGVRRQVESLMATAEFQQFQLEAAYLTLTSNVVAAAVQEASLRGQIAATEEIIKIQTDSADILRKQLALGQVAGADVATVEATLAQAQATLPPLQKQLAAQRDLLTALIGRFPSQEPAEKFELASLQLPLELPVSVPSKLVEQRPDIQSAAAQLHAASASIGVAVAAILPTFTLTGNAGTTGNQISQLFLLPNTAFWSLAGNVAQTVFDAGTLLHKKRAADAAFDQAAETYRSTVITAFQNVADALHAVQSDADTLKAAFAAERAAFKSLEIARAQLRLGAIGYLALLTTENTYDMALLALVQAQAARYADTAALFQALGGGWWNREDIPPAKKWDIQLIP
ncbi:MAG: efflux transporter outer membrane subunit [Alphaproteobacteria bacterium]|nr:efflux transporter outer membrane subunit [Alphaproteobacteria bacterium]MBV9198800.1 efflux transporter outer membrane subunit [Alphaproteobacteria bacterium]MBV9373672.1 efflux transporter outer membrane subunit [Alphaproteobacteria bacterium]MBV9686633.1 efflux transporter outer membrane subunit [Alphaproteobacteria bacterium]